MVRRFEPGRYTVTDISSGLALDLSGANNGTVHAWELYGGTRQQWEFRPCGDGFIIDSVHSSGSFITVRDLNGLHRGGSARVVAAAFPTCWDVEVLPVGPTDTEPGNVFARIRLPYSDGTQMTLGFKKTHQKEPSVLANDLCTFWRLRPVADRSEQVVENTPITTNEIVVEGGGVKKTVLTTMSMTTATRTITRVVPSEG